MLAGAFDVALFAAWMMCGSQSLTSNELAQMVLTQVEFIVFVNFMGRLSYLLWWTDKKMLRYPYMALVQSEIDYKAQVYVTLKLEVLQ